MAISNTNMITMGYHGRVSNFVLRRWGDRSILSSVPVFKKNRWSKAQKLNRRRFREAMHRTQAIMKNPEMSRYYRSRRKRRQTAWNVAVADYMKKPEIKRTDLSGYQGRKGDPIRIDATDNYGVARVLITILSSQGLLVEWGTAMQDAQGSGWTYIAGEENPYWKGGRVEIAVNDRPGNVTKTVLRL